MTNKPFNLLEALFETVESKSATVKMIIGKNKTEYTVPKEFSQDFQGATIYVLGQLQDQIDELRKPSQPLKQSECQHEHDGKILASNPPQFKCTKCEKTVFMFDPKTGRGDFHYKYDCNVQGHQND